MLHRYAHRIVDGTQWVMWGVGRTLMEVMRRRVAICPLRLQPPAKLDFRASLPVIIFSLWHCEDYTAVL